MTTAALPWVQQCPRDWTKGRLKDLVASVANGVWGNEPAGDGSDVYCVRAADFDRNRRRVSRTHLPLRQIDGGALRSNRLFPGDIILEKSGGGENQPVGAAVLFDLQEPSVCSNFCARVIPASGTDSRFLTYILASAYYLGLNGRAIKQTTGIQNLDATSFFASPWAWPDTVEQRRIADFLDANITRLDRLVDARTKQLDALKEHELATIYEHFTGGNSHECRAQVHRRWLPRPPDGWRSAPVYALYDVQLGKMLNAERASGKNRYPYLRNANVTWYSTDTSDLAEMEFLASETERYSVKPGDLLVCEGGAGVAEAAVWQHGDGDVYYQKSLHRVRQRLDVPVEWLMYWLRIAKAAGLFAAEGNVATIPHLTCEQLRVQRIPVPPDSERRVSAIAVEIERLAETAELIRRAVLLTRERMQALITAAVTGQIDVTTARGVDVP